MGRVTLGAFQRAGVWGQRTQGRMTARIANIYSALVFGPDSPSRPCEAADREEILGNGMGVVGEISINCRSSVWDPKIYRIRGRNAD